MTEMPTGQVTVADLFRVMSEMRTDMGKALAHLEVIDSRNKNADDVHRDHEFRIRAIESWRWKATGAATMAGILAGAGGSWLGFLIARK